MKQCYDMMRKLNLRKPLGPFTIPAWAILDGESIIIEHLTFFINTCIYKDVFPTELEKEV